MNEDTQAPNHEFNRLAEDAQALMLATADVAGDKIEDARKRLAVALENGKAIYGKVRTKAIEGAKAADEAIVTHPYQALAIGVGVGAVIGYLVARQGACTRD